MQVEATLGLEGVSSVTVRWAGINKPEKIVWTSVVTPLDPYRFGSRLEDGLSKHEQLYNGAKRNGRCLPSP